MTPAQRKQFIAAVLALAEGLRVVEDATVIARIQHDLSEDQAKGFGSGLDRLKHVLPCFLRTILPDRYHAVEVDGADLDTMAELVLLNMSAVGHDRLEFMAEHFVDQVLGLRCPITELGDAARDLA